MADDASDLLIETFNGANEDLCDEVPCYTDQIFLRNEVN